MRKFLDYDGLKTLWTKILNLIQLSTANIGNESITYSKLDGSIIDKFISLDGKIELLGYTVDNLDLYLQEALDSRLGISYISVDEGHLVITDKNGYNYVFNSSSTNSVKIPEVYFGDTLIENTIKVDYPKDGELEVTLKYGTNAVVYYTILKDSETVVDEYYYPDVSSPTHTVKIKELSPTATNKITITTHAEINGSVSPTIKRYIEVTESASIKAPEIRVIGNESDALVYVYCEYSDKSLINNLQVNITNNTTGDSVTGSLNGTKLLVNRPSEIIAKCQYGSQENSDWGPTSKAKVYVGIPEKVIVGILPSNLADSTNLVQSYSRAQDPSFNYDIEVAYNKENPIIELDILTYIKDKSISTGYPYIIYPESIGDFSTSSPWYKSYFDTGSLNGKLISIFSLDDLLNEKSIQFRFLKLV